MKKPKALVPPTKDTRKELYFEIQESCVSDHRSSEPYGDWKSQHMCRLVRVSRIKELLNKWSFQAHKVPDEVYDATSVYVVVVTYSTGDTFGSSSGNMAIAFVTENANEALECKNALLEEEQYDYESSYSFREKTGKTPKWSNDFRQHPKSVHGGYAPWNGYFEHIESVDIEFMQTMG